MQFSRCRWHEPSECHFYCDWLKDAAMSRISRNPSLRFFQDFDVGILLDGGTRHRPPLHKNHVICFTRYLQRFPQALFSRFLSCQQVISSGLISGFSETQPKKIISNDTCRFWVLTNCLSAISRTLRGIWKKT